MFFFVIFVIIIIKITIIIIIFIIATIIIKKKFRSFAQNVVFDVRKNRTKLPELGERGGGVRGFGQCLKENVVFLQMSSLS